MANLPGPMLAQRLMQGNFTGSAGGAAPMVQPPMQAPAMGATGGGSLGWLGLPGGPRFANGPAPVAAAPPAAPTAPPLDPYMTILNSGGIG